VAVSLDVSAASAPTDVRGLDAFITDTAAALVRAASTLRAASSSDPRAYRLLRVGAWLAVESLPPADAQGKTRIPPPNKALRNGLSTLLEHEQWETLLMQCEGLLADWPLWLDLNTLCLRALAGLGSTHDAARQAVEAETRAFAARFPDLLRMQHGDGSPLAAPHTVAWLTPGPAAASETAGDAPTLGSELRAAVMQGATQAGPKLDAMLASCRSERDAFVLKIELAEALLSGGRPEASATLLLGLERLLDSHQLESWEPDLARRTLRGLRDALTRAGPTAAGHPELARVCARLARLAPSDLI
jgi:type VI secretion system protein VasJ